MAAKPRSPERTLSTVAPAYLGRLHAAAFLDVHPTYLDKLIRRGQIPAFKVGRKVLVRRVDLEKFVEGQPL